LGYSIERLSEIFEKNNGLCRHCGKQLAFDNYGKYGTRGAWHVDHSVPISKGGTDNLRNLWALCIGCNLDKSDSNGSNFDDGFEARSTVGKVVEFFGGRAGDLGTDPRRVPKR